MITPGIGNEPHMDSSQQEESTTSLPPLSVTEQKVRDETEINYDNELGQTDYKKYSLLTILLVKQSKKKE